MKKETTTTTTDKYININTYIHENWAIYCTSENESINRRSSTININIYINKRNDLELIV